MKLFFLALCAAFGLATAAASAQGAPPATQIVVTGTGSVALAPTLATVSAAVETNAPNAGTAVSQNNTVYNRIVAALEKLGIARSDISLAYYNVNYNPKPRVMPPNPDGQRYGYTVSRSFSVKVHDIAKAGNVADACTSSGATAINGVDFGLADPNAARSEATTRAVADARGAAEALAAAAHLRIVGIKRIGLGGSGRIFPQPMMRMAANAIAPPTQFDASNVNVTVTVDVTFVALP